MSEKYISASKLKAHYSWLDKDATLSPKDVDDIIDAQPAADVEPVVRGECDHCSSKEQRTEQGEPYWMEWYLIQNGCNFCPNCGRKLERSGDA